MSGAVALFLSGGLRARAATTASPTAVAPFAQAEAAINDLLGHFWEGTAGAGHITPTWKGYKPGATPLPDVRGALWERAMMYNALYEYHALTGDPVTKTRLQSDWVWVNNAFGGTQLDLCGRPSEANWASDDTGWDSLYMLQAHAITGDPAALRHAEAAVKCGYSRWRDSAPGSSLWYDDSRQYESLYEIALALAALNIFDLTRDAWFLNAAVASEAWMRQALRRTDGLYWCAATAKGPYGADRPSDIHPGASVTYIAGNMGMSVLQSRLASRLNRPDLKTLANETSIAVAQLMVDSQGVLIDDRDAWTDGYFSVLWAQEGLPPQGPDQAALRRTATAVFTRDRTGAGYYGPDWDGPTPDSTWIRNGTRAMQIMTSANAVTMILAGAAL